MEYMDKLLIKRKKLTKTTLKSDIKYLTSMLKKIEQGKQTNAPLFDTFVKLIKITLNLYKKRRKNE